LPDETGGPVYVSGSGFPQDVERVSIYVVRDRDRWTGSALPRGKSAGLVKGPVVAPIVDGMLPPTSTRFAPGPRDLGVYDIIVDVDRDGVFDYETTQKDAIDGEAKVGFTVQRSAKWLEGRKDKHLLANIAFDSSSRDKGAWRNTYSPGESVFAYINPAIGRKPGIHGHSYKWVVIHRDFKTFWDRGDANGVPFHHLAVNKLDGLPQRGCTNTPPTYVFTARARLDPDTGRMANAFDIVIDQNGDGRYMPGIDLLDVAGLDETPRLISPTEQRETESNGGFVVVAPLH
jgi:hypothetical protein